MPITDFQQIPKMTREATYSISVFWNSLEQTLRDLADPDGIDLDPDFQRAHVWTVEQQIRYVEFTLRGGRSAKTIMFNKAFWPNHDTSNQPMVLVDGKQRLRAVSRFMNNEIPAFGTLYGDFTGKMRMTDAKFEFMINDLPTRADVLQWYIDLNAGGVAHTDGDIQKVRELLAAEQAPLAPSM